MAYKNPKDQVRAMRRWYLKNKSRVRIAGRKWRAANPEKQMVISARLRALRCKLPFSITFKDIIIPKRCPALGILLKKKPGPLCDNSPSLDRVIPSLGYIPGNIVVLSNKANSIKRNANSSEIQAVATWLKKKEKSTT